MIEQKNTDIKKKKTQSFAFCWPLLQLSPILIRNTPPLSHRTHSFFLLFLSLPRSEQVVELFALVNIHPEMFPNEATNGWAWTSAKLQSKVICLRVLLNVVCNVYINILASIKECAGEGKDGWKQQMMRDRGRETLRGQKCVCVCLWVQ